MATTILPDLTGMRITLLWGKSGSPGTIEAFFDRPLGLTTKISLASRLPRNIYHLKSLIGTDLGEVALQLAAGETCGNVHIEDRQTDDGVVGCITLDPPRNSGATWADLLDDILRLAGQPAVQGRPQDLSALVGEIERAFNKYLDVLEQESLPKLTVTCKLPSTHNERSLLWTCFNEDLTNWGPVTLDDPFLLARYIGRSLPWMGDLLHYLAEQEVVAGGDIAVSLPKQGMRLFSLPVTAQHPTPLDCLEAIIAAAERFAGCEPSEQDLVAISRETRWSETLPAITDPLARISWRWSLALRKHARANAG